MEGTPWTAKQATASVWREARQPTTPGTEPSRPLKHTEALSPQELLDVLARLLGVDD